MVYQTYFANGADWSKIIPEQFYLTSVLSLSQTLWNIFRANINNFHNKIFQLHHQPLYPPPTSSFLCLLHDMTVFFWKIYIIFLCLLINSFLSILMEGVEISCIPRTVCGLIAVRYGVFLSVMFLPFDKRDSIFTKKFQKHWSGT